VPTSSSAEASRPGRSDRSGTAATTPPNLPPTRNKGRWCRNLASAVALLHPWMGTRPASTTRVRWPVKLTSRKTPSVTASTSAIAGNVRRAGSSKHRLTDRARSADLTGDTSGPHRGRSAAALPLPPRLPYSRASLAEEQEPRHTARRHLAAAGKSPKDADELSWAVLGRLALWRRASRWCAVAWTS